MHLTLKIKLMISFLVLFISLLSGCTDGSIENSPVSSEEVSPVSLAVSPKGQIIHEGDTLQLEVMGAYSGRSVIDLTRHATWSSSNTGVATVSRSGLVKAVAEGETIITAATENTSDSILLKVTLPEPRRTGIRIDHTCTDLESIPEYWIGRAKTDLHIAYAHTSYDSQLITDMTGLFSWRGYPYTFDTAGSGRGLDLRDNPLTGEPHDLGYPDLAVWADRTRSYLNEHGEINVVVWSWESQVSEASEADIDTYLNLMNTLEREYPAVRFVYMTDRLDGTGLSGNQEARNEQIRAYCRNAGKILYDFADIEAYDPDGTYSKAYAAWWLWARLAGWNGT